MIGIPVLLVAMASVAYRTAEHSENSADFLLRGAADALVTAESSPIHQDYEGQSVLQSGTVRATLDPADRRMSAGRVAELTGGTVTVEREGNALVRTERGALATSVREFDLRDPSTAGLGAVVEGRAPRRADEVAVSADLADAGFGPGEPVTLETDGRERTYRIAGVVRDPRRPWDREVVGPHGSVLDEGAEETFLVDTPDAVSWAEVQVLNTHGLLVRSRAVLENPPPDGQLPPELRGSSSNEDPAAVALSTLIVACVLLEVILLAGPAFAVGARRQSRQLALFVATGGTPKDVRNIVLAQAGVLGLGSAVVGILLSIVGVALTLPLWSRLVGRDIAPVWVAPLDLVVLAVVGTGAALAAAFVPARQAAGQETVAALAGRRGETRTRRGWPVAGLALAGIGTAVVLIGGGSNEVGVVVGTLVTVAGAIMATPTVIGLVGRLGARLPLALRMAARDTARHRSRTAPAVAAIMGVVTGVTALAIGSASDFAESRRDYVPQAAIGTMTADLWDAPRAGVERLRREMAAEVPGRTPVVVRTAAGTWTDMSDHRRRAVLVRPHCTDPDPSGCAVEFDLPKLHSSQQVEEKEMGGISQQFEGMVVGDIQAVEALLGRSLTAAQRRTLEAGGVLVPTATALHRDHTASVRTFRLGGAPEEGDPPSVDVRTERLPATVLRGDLRGDVYTYLAELVASPETAWRLGTAARPAKLVVPPGMPEVSVEQEERLNEVATGLGIQPVYVERGFVRSYTPILLVLAVVGGLIVLVGTATATALALDDARPDFATLAAIGAAPRTRRRMAVAQAGVVAALGVTSGVLVGAVPGIAVTWPLTAGSPGGHVLDIPWSLLGIVALGVPLLAMVGAGLLTRSSVPMVRRAE